MTTIDAMTRPAAIAPATPRPRTREKVSRALLGRILRGAVPVGEKLPTERALAAEFQVNRATVREALRYLESLELVAIRQGDGAYVQSVLESANPEAAKAMVQVDEAMRLEVLGAILEVRRINGPEIAYAAALRRTKHHLDQLEEVICHWHDRGVMERDQAVHRIISLAGGNIIQVLMTNFCQDFFDDFGHLYFARAANRRRSERFHREILQALREQNAGVARDIMRDVLQYAEAAIYDALAQETAAETVRRWSVGFGPKTLIGRTN